MPRSRRLENEVGGADISFVGEELSTPTLEAHGGCGALALVHGPCPDLFTAGAVKRRRPVSQRKVSMRRETGSVGGSVWKVCRKSLGGV